MVLRPTARRLPAGQFDGNQEECGDDDRPANDAEADRATGSCRRWPDVGCGITWDRQDIDVWLELRRRAFARQKVGVRDWDAADFAARVPATRAGGSRKAMWFAEMQPPAAPGARPSARSRWLAAAMPPDDEPVVHWLAVLPSHRRRRVGRLLMAALEAAVWDAGRTPGVAGNARAVGRGRAALRVAGLPGRGAGE